MSSPGTNYSTVILSKSITANLTVTDVVLYDINATVAANETYPLLDDCAQTQTINQIFTSFLIQNLSIGTLYVNVLEDPTNAQTFTTGTEPGTFAIPDFLGWDSSDTIKRLRFFKTGGGTINFKIILERSDK